LKFVILNLIGLSVARIFHGIPSPKFPVFDWCKNSFWGKYVHVDFEKLRSIATKCIFDEKRGKRSQST